MVYLAQLKCSFHKKWIKLFTKEHVLFNTQISVSASVELGKVSRPWPQEDDDDVDS